MSLAFFLNFQHQYFFEVIVSNVLYSALCFLFCRTIANLDIKLDFVPPAFINFVSRQLIGSGFKLYKKVNSSSTIDFSL